FLPSAPRTNAPPLLTTLSFILVHRGRNDFKKDPGTVHLPHHEVRSTGAPYVCYPSRPSYSPTCPPTHSVQSSPRDPLHEDAIMTPEPTLSSFAWLAASATMYDMPSAVSEQASVRCSNMEEYYVCPLPRSSTQPTFFPLVHDTHDPVGATASWPRRRDLVPRENAQAFSEGPHPMAPMVPIPMWVRTDLSFGTGPAITSVFSRCTRPGGAQRLIVGPRRPPERRQGSLINTLGARKTREAPLQQFPPHVMEILRSRKLKS
ncbi:hypothetical protein EDB89DRAFT_2137898, partial [Lactarius sanguifluus]